MSGIQSIFYWLSALLMAISFFASLLSVFLKKHSFFIAGRIILLMAGIMLTVFGVIRWIDWTHPPFVTLFESMITAIWFLLLMYFMFIVFSKKYALLLLPVSLISFLLMGWSASLPSEASTLSAALSNTWLFIHASFATSGAAAFLIAASLSILFLSGEKKMNSLKAFISSIPEYGRLPESALKMTLLGLILWGVMIVSGSIWAHIAWGRYWAWDPIELWSLISWLLYGLLIHARLAFKMNKRLFAWLTIFASLTVAFSLWGIQYVYETIHTYG